MKNIYLLLFALICISSFVSATSGSSNFLNLGDSVTLSPIGTGISSASVETYNTTWLNFNGRNTWVSVPSPLGSPLRFNNTKSITVSLWYYRAGDCSNTLDGVTGTPCAPIAQSKGNGPNIGWDIVHNGGNIQLALRNGTAAVSAPSWGAGLYPNNTWTHLAFTWNGTNIYLYKDGILSNSATYSGSFAYPDANLTIGIRNQVVDSSNNHFWNGSLGEIKFYNQSLAAEEIYNIYESSNFKTGDSIPVVNYHGIKAVPTSEYDTPTANFTYQMNWLYQNNYTCITYTDYYNYTQGKFVLPYKPVIVSFDDGLDSHYTIAYATMQPLGCKGNIHIVTGNVGLAGSLNWTQIHTMFDNGWDVSSHSVNHSNFVTQLPTPALRIAQFNQSYNDITNNLSIAPTIFVYPYNSRNDTTDAECDNFYPMCNGRGTIQYIYRNSNLTNGGFTYYSLNRVHIGNVTTDSVFRSYFGVDDLANQILGYRLAENKSYQTLDYSTNSINGTIMVNITSSINGSFGNDNVLINATGYTLNTATGLLTLPSDFLYSLIVTSWEYVTGDGTSSCEAINTQVIGWIGLVGLIGTVFLISLVVMLLGGFGGYKGPEINGPVILSTFLIVLAVGILLIVAVVMFSALCI